MLSLTAPGRAILPNYKSVNHDLLRCDSAIHLEGWIHFRLIVGFLFICYLWGLIFHGWFPFSDLSLLF